MVFAALQFDFPMLCSTSFIKSKLAKIIVSENVYHIKKLKFEIVQNGSKHVYNWFGVE